MEEISRIYVMNQQSAWNRAEAIKRAEEEREARFRKAKEEEARRQELDKKK
jgi:hypothetical protein